MANSLLIEKQTGGYFKFTLNGDTANAITSIQNDLLAVGSQLHFKTGNGANIIKEQFIYPEDVTVIASGTFTFTTVADVWNKLIEIDYFAWLGTGTGGGGVDRFDDLLDTFKYVGNAGKTVIVDNSELKLIPVTFYNKRLFTELEDTPDSLVPNKMVVVNSDGTELVLQDQPEVPESLLNSVGYFDYNDSITQTTPLNAVTNVPLKLTNDTEGANTSTSENPYGVSYVWDYTTNQFNFSELSVGDTIDVRIHVQVTTTTSNQKVVLSAKFGIGSVAEFENSIYESVFKTAGIHEISFVAPFYMGSTYITDYPAELYLTTDASATVKVNGWYIRIIRRNINIVTVDYQVPDATTLAKGIVRLAGDLAGTANNPTVPGLATKVPTSRTVSTTSPLLGGGALTADLVLSIQQANSTQSGYLSAADWSTFYNKANDNAVVHLTGDEVITGRKTFNSTTDIGIRSNNSGTGYGFYGNNSSNGVAVYAVNEGQGKAFVADNILGSLGNLFEGRYNGVIVFASNYLGEVTGSKFIKSGGTSSQFLKADGSVDSSVYHTGSLTSNYVPKATGTSTLGNSLIYDNGTNVIIGGSGSNSNRLTVVEGGTTLVGQQILMQNASNANDALNIVHSGTGKLIKGTTVSTEVFNITNSGGAYFADKVGIGIVPQGVGSTKSLEIGSRGVIYDNNDNFAFINNAWYDTTFRYKQTGAAANMSTDGGNFVFGNAPSGSQNASFSFTERMRIDQNGNVGIGTATIAGLNKALALNDSSNCGIILKNNNVNKGYFYNSGNNIYIETTGGTLYAVAGSNGVYLPNGGIAWFANSDEKLKTDLLPIEDGLSKVCSLRSLIGRYKTDEEDKRRPFLIAQDVLKVLPEAVFENEETGNLGVSYSEVIPLLVAAIKELKAEIQTLKN